MPIKIECPSGLKGKVRGLSGKDGRFLTDRKLTKSGQLMDAILEACWVETIDPSIYKMGAGALNWQQVLVGDRFYALIQIKIAAEEDSTHTFRHQCTEVNCREGFDQVIDLDDLPVRMLAKEQKTKLTNGENMFSVRMPTTEQTKKIEGARAIEIIGRKKVEIIPDTGDRINFKLSTGADELRMFKLAKQNKLSDNKMIQSIAQKIEGIEIVKGKEEGIEVYESMDIDKKHQAVVDYLEDFSISAIARLLDRMDELDCGVDTLIEIECPHCSNLMRVDLPLDESFFFPRKRRVVS